MLFSTVLPWYFYRILVAAANTMQVLLLCVRLKDWWFLFLLASACTCSFVALCREVERGYWFVGGWVWVWLCMW